jgi:hypothetical protein
MCMLLSTPEVDVRRMGDFLRGNGYSTERLSGELELSEGLFATGENLQPLLMKTEGDSLLPVLARLFFVGWPVELERCAKVIPADILNTALDCGLLQRAGPVVEPLAAIVPFRGHLIASDSSRLRGSNPEMVLGPGASTHFLARLAAGGKDETTLDLGSGTGVLAVEAAAYSKHVTGTDINSRSLQFARFTAVLNGVTNSTFLCGDAFAPVQGRRFSRIIANPPFFLTPSKQFTYCDSPLELDGFSRRLALEVPEFLEEGGYFQMICQWVDLEDQSWEHRLRTWTAGSGCDVLVLLAPQTTPIVYAEVRDREARQSHSVSELDFPSRVQYLRERGVKTIYSGVISMRKRNGPNWFSLISNAPAGEHVGHGLRERFQTLTFLAGSSDPDLLRTRFQFAADVVMQTMMEPAVPAWRTASIELIKSEALVDRLKLDAVVSECLPYMDGKRTLQHVADMVETRLGISSEESRARCLQLTRRLLQTSYILPVEGTAPTP